MKTFFKSLMLVAALVFTSGAVLAQSRQIQPSDVGIQTPLTIGNLLAGGPGTTQIQDTAALPGFVNAPVGIKFGSNISYGSGTASGPANSWLYTQATIAGTSGANAPDSYTSPFNIFISSDTVDTTTSGSGTLNGFTIYHKLVTGYTGTRNAFVAKLDIRGTAVNNATYTAGTFLTSGNSNLGGTSGAYTNYKGGAFAANPNIFMLSGATNLISIVGQEIDVSIASGANSANKFGMSIDLGSLDVNRGDYDDAAISFGVQTGAATTWKRGISFGQYAGGWAFDVDSTLIGAQTRQAGGTTTPVALYGVDFSAVTFQSSGGFLKSTGFLVDPTGSVIESGTGTPTLASGKLTLSGIITAPTFGANGEGALYLVSTRGLTLQGQGSTWDIAFVAKTGTVAAAVPTGVATLQLPNVATGTPTASLCIDASNNIIKKTTTGSCI